MQKTTYSSHYDIVISDLLRELELKVDEADRCQEMIARVNCYDPNSKLPIEIVDFIGNYTKVGMVSNEGLIRDTSSVLKTIFDGLMTAIKWILEKLAEIFKYLFNSEYRTCREALDLQRRVITISTNQTKVNTFENTMCNVIPRSDIDNIIFKTTKLVEIIKNVASLSRQDYTDTLMQTYCNESGIGFDQDTFRVYDSLPNPTPMAGTTFANAGWTMTGITEVLSSYLAMLKGIESLKETSKRLNDAVSDLKKRVLTASEAGASPADITEMQKECATKINATKIAGFAIAVCCRRSENILAFITQIYHSAQTK